MVCIKRVDEANIQGQTALPDPGVDRARPQPKKTTMSIIAKYTARSSFSRVDIQCPDLDLLWSICKEIDLRHSISLVLGVYLTARPIPFHEDLTMIAGRLGASVTRVDNGR